MKIDIHKNYLKISELASFAEFIENKQKLSDDITEKEIPAVIFDMDSCDMSDMQKELMLDIPALTVAVKKDFSGVLADIMTAFDIRLSENIYTISADDYSAMDKERYALLCGSVSAYELKKQSESGKAQLETKLVKVLEGEGTFEDKVSGYFEKLFKDKTSFESVSIVKCLVKARSGIKEDVFEAESLNFYRLVKRKSEECSDGDK